MLAVNPPAQELLEDPQWLLFDLQISQRKALWLRLNEQDLAAASFLDQRVLAQAQSKLRTPLEWLAEVPQRTQPLRWVFHCGHVGSTLLSRLLQSASTRVLREPQVLRTLAAARREAQFPWSPWSVSDWWQQWAAPSLQLLARHRSDEQGTLIKATSSTSHLLPDILQQRSEDRAILLAAPLDLYLAAFQISASAQQDLQAFAPARWQTFQGWCGRPLPSLDRMKPAQISAMSWLVTVAPLVRALQAHPERCQALDFAQLMDAPRACAQDCAQHLHWPEPPHLSPWLNHYAKDPSQRYNSAQRWQQLSAARELLVNQAEGLMAWLAHVLKADDPLQKFLARGLVWGTT